VSERVEAFKQLQRQVKNYHARLGLAVAQAEVSSNSTTTTSPSRATNELKQEKQQHMSAAVVGEEVDNIQERLKKMSVVGEVDVSDDYGLSTAMSRVGLHDSNIPSSLAA
jgi:hypothetical protein